MADKKSVEKRCFYKEKILKIQSQLSDESVFEKLSLYELNEFSSALTTTHDKFELKCLALSWDADLDGQPISKKFEEENALLDIQFIKLKAKLNKRIDEIKNGEKDALKEEIHAFESQEAKKEKRQLKNTWGVFNGKIEAFPQFYANFTTAMVSEKDLSDDEKLDLLLAACKDDAKNAVVNLSYKEALKNLENVYGNVYRQMQCHARNFLNIKPVTVASSNSLQAFYNELCKCEDDFKQCVSVNENDYMLTFVAIGKLDKDTTKVWERYRLSLAESWANIEEASTSKREAKDHLPSFEAFKAFLRSEINMLLGEESKSCDTKGKNEMAKFVSEVKSQVPSFLQCKLCDDIHPIYKCVVFKAWSLKDKDVFISENNLCVKCLRKFHVGKCRDALCNNECPKCPPATYHNSILCPENMANKNKQSPGKAQKNPNWGSEEEWD